MLNRRVFHESFDSTRATAYAPDDGPNLIQGQIEAVISLLLGRSLAINNTYGLDSRTVLELAAATLSTRARVIDELRSPEARERLRASAPFVLFCWGQPDYLAACADQFSRHDRQARNYFRLSAWGPINDDATARDQIAGLLTRAAAGDTDVPFPTGLANSYPMLHQHYDTVLRLNDYFKGPSLSQAARKPTIQVGEYVHRLTSMDDAELRANEENGCPADLAIQVRQALEGRLAAVEDPNFLRGWAHDTVNSFDEENPEREGPERIREFVDTVYNAVLADSAQSDFEYMSSVPRADGRDDLVQVNKLAMRIIRHTRSDAMPNVDIMAEERLATRMGGLLEAAAVLPRIAPQPLEQILLGYWELLADADGAHTWTQSTDRLHEELLTEHLDRHRFQDTWQAHLSHLGQLLSHTVEVDGVRMRIGVAHGGRTFEQTQQVGDIDPAARDAALAAGEHLDELGQAASGVRDEHLDASGQAASEVRDG